MSAAFLVWVMIAVTITFQSPRQFGRWIYKVRAGFEAQRREENP